MSVYFDDMLQVDSVHNALYVHRIEVTASCASYEHFVYGVLLQLSCSTGTVSDFAAFLLFM